MLIGEIAEKSGFSRDTIRYYEKIGLIQTKAFDRHPNNYKNYSNLTLQRLTQIFELKSVGFTLTEIRGLLKDFEKLNGACVDLPAKLDAKISQINEKMKLLNIYKRALKKIQMACDGKCSATTGIPNCVTC